MPCSPLPRPAASITEARRRGRLPGQLNWWIGSVFALGSLLFLLGSALSLNPSMALRLTMGTAAVNRLFALGSIPFTTAAYLQLFQAANAGRSSRQPIRWFGWRPRELGWLSCALQFPGTILFNINTIAALDGRLTWLGQDGLVWVPDLLGSLLFVASGWLAFLETCHGHGFWRPGSLSWWVTVLNLLGCIGFMGAALTGLMLFTLLGALGFLIGSLLLLPEAVVPS